MATSALHPHRSPFPTLATALVPTASSGTSALVRSAALVVTFSAVIALSAQVSLPLPFTLVPLTLQTLAVLLTGAALGTRLGALTLLAYCAEGLLGLPVFSYGSSALGPSVVPGIPWLLGPTSGYVLGMVVAAPLVGFLAEHGWDRSVWRTVLAMVLGNVVIYAFGLAELARFEPAADLLTAGVWGFLPGDAVKIVVAALALPAAWKIVGRSRL